ncbi:hypothetical protein K1T71_006113 [Dendrolimus kikuchii]|uniref:Uncharacterized protein n=1 Tax=Dendrolimus kikuchii TaxID=765133 RepID=A0ACC1D336_9NEOP|nr:hypothetical protein K1T71_006113 [Dendrolimus kikuchii]
MNQTATEAPKVDKISFEIPLPSIEQEIQPIIPEEDSQMAHNQQTGESSVPINDSVNSDSAQSDSDVDITLSTRSVLPHRDTDLQNEFRDDLLRELERGYSHFLFIKMQILFALMRTLPSLSRDTINILPKLTSSQQPALKERLLSPFVPIVNPSCGFKVKGRVRRRCKSCYLVVRDERTYVICPKFPRHKQMSMVPKPHNTWILTHASQSPIRPW